MAQTTKQTFIKKNMNKKTARARKGNPREGVAPLTNNPEVTIGTGAGRQIGTRNADPIFKGKACNTARPAGKNRWVGALVASKRMGQGNDG